MAARAAGRGPAPLGRARGEIDRSAALRGLARRRSGSWEPVRAAWPTTSLSRGCFRGTSVSRLRPEGLVSLRCAERVPGSRRDRPYCSRDQRGGLIAVPHVLGHALGRILERCRGAPPVHQPDDLRGDGGVMNNSPVRVSRRTGAGRVRAVGVALPRSRCVRPSEAGSSSLRVEETGFHNAGQHFAGWRPECRR